jgi:hypothetical protein
MERFTKRLESGPDKEARCFWSLSNNVQGCELVEHSGNGTFVKPGVTRNLPDTDPFWVESNRFNEGDNFGRRSPDGTIHACSQFSE